MKLEEALISKLNEAVDNELSKEDCTKLKDAIDQLEYEGYTTFGTDEDVKNDYAKAYYSALHIAKDIVDENEGFTKEELVYDLEKKQAEIVSDLESLDYLDEDDLNQEEVIEGWQDAFDEVINLINGEKQEEARSHKEDNEKASPRTRFKDLPAFTSAADNAEDRAHYGKGMTKRDKVRGEEQAKANLDKFNNGDTRVTSGNVVDKVSYDKLPSQDIETYKYRKDMANIYNGKGPQYDKTLTVNGQSKLNNTVAAKNWEDSAKEVVDVAKNKHRKAEARSHKEDNETAAPRVSTLDSVVSGKYAYGVYDDKDERNFADRYKEPINAKRNKVKNFDARSAEPKSAGFNAKDMNDKINQAVTHKDYEKMPNEKSRAYLDSKKESKKLTEDKYVDALQEYIKTEDDLIDFKNWLEDLSEMTENIYDRFVDMPSDARNAIDDIFNEDACPSYCIRWLGEALEDLTNIAKNELKVTDEENEEN